MIPAETPRVRNGIKIESVDNSRLIEGMPGLQYEIRKAVLSGQYDCCILMQDPLGFIIWSVGRGLCPHLGPGSELEPIIICRRLPQVERKQRVSKKTGRLAEKSECVGGHDQNGC